MPEAALWSRRDSDLWARDELVRRYMPFAVSHANRFNGGPDSFDDLLQVASVGLVNAVDRFDPSHGSAFAAFATPTINGELKRYFRDRIWLVRVPRGLQERIQAVDKAKSALSAELHRDPTVIEIADRADLTETEVDEAILAKADRHPISLDFAGDDEDHAPAVSVGREEPGYSRFDDTDQIRSAVINLDETSRLVLRLRFIEEMTQS
ncbi:MAG: sigma-70 family RNA polymerase sigma factor, partial [Solirubrobacterales bacterium]